MGERYNIYQIYNIIIQKKQKSGLPPGKILNGEYTGKAIIIVFPGCNLLDDHSMYIYYMLSVAHTSHTHKGGYKYSAQSLQFEYPSQWQLFHPHNLREERSIWICDQCVLEDNSGLWKQLYVSDNPTGQQGIKHLHSIDT